MIEPTLDNLCDPYVLQLIEELAKRDDRIAELEAEARWRANGAFRDKPDPALEDKP